MPLCVPFASIALSRQLISTGIEGRFPALLGLAFQVRGLAGLSPLSRILLLILAVPAFGLVVEEGRVRIGPARRSQWTPVLYCPLRLPAQTLCSSVACGTRSMFTITLGRADSVYPALLPPQCKVRQASQLLLNFASKPVTSPPKLALVLAWWSCLCRYCRERLAVSVL